MKTKLFGYYFEKINENFEKENNSQEEVIDRYY